MLIGVYEHCLDDLVQRFEVNRCHVPNNFWTNAVVFVPQLVAERFDFAPRDFGVFGAQVSGKIFHRLGNDQKSVLERVAQGKVVSDMLEGALMNERQRKRDVLLDILKARAR